MSVFRFRLATLLRLREAHRDERSRELNEALEADQALAQQMHGVVGELTSTVEQTRRAAAPGVVDVDRLLETQRHEMVLRAQRKAIEQQLALLAEEIERRRQVLTVANQEVRVLEKLRENLQQRHRQAENDREIKALDESSQRVRGSKDIR